ncbi:CPBP family intramembrane metalloprotease, partial [Methylobacterium sp. WL9]
MHARHAAQAGPERPAEPATSPPIGLGRWLLQAVLFVAIPVVVLALAGILSLVLVRIVADYRIGLDIFTPTALRPRLPIYEEARRGVAADVLRQVLIAGFAVGLALWQ